VDEESEEKIEEILEQDHLDEYFAANSAVRITLCLSPLFSFSLYFSLLFFIHSFSFTLSFVLGGTIRYSRAIISPHKATRGNIP
jgi:hypothetical protein